jgi:hypothetical protein
VTLDVQRTDATVTLPARRHRRRALVIAVVALFQFWMWGTRLWNLLRDPEGFSAVFIGVHAVLFTVGIATGVVLAGVAFGMVREQRGPT